MSLKNLQVPNEPKVVADIRKKIITEFDDLIFDPEPHKYYLNGVDLPSVSAVTHQFVEETDFTIVAEKYAVKHGETAEYWLDKWKFNNLKATTTGTSVHEYGESLGWLRNGHPELITEENKVKYIKDKEWLIPTRAKEEAVLKFWDEFPENLHFVLAETKVYSNKGEASKVKQQFAGTFDLLTYYKHPTDSSKDGLVIWDYKTNKSLYNDYNREYDKMLLPPFDHMIDEPLSLYTLQLSLYALCLRGIGLNVIGNRVIWLKDDCDYRVIKVDDLSKEDWFRGIF